MNPKIYRLTMVDGTRVVFITSSMQRALEMIDKLNEVDGTDRVVDEVTCDGEIDAIDNDLLKLLGTPSESVA